MAARSLSTQGLGTLDDDTCWASVMFRLYSSLCSGVASRRPSSGRSGMSPPSKGPEGSG